MSDKTLVVLAMVLARVFTLAGLAAEPAAPASTAWTRSVENLRQDMADWRDLQQRARQLTVEPDRELIGALDQAVQAMEELARVGGQASNALPYIPPIQLQRDPVQQAAYADKMAAIRKGQTQGVRVTNAALVNLVALWTRRDQPGWYDRAMVEDKFRYPRSEPARQGDPVQLAVFAAAEKAYLAKCRAEGLMTSERALLPGAPAAAETPEMPWNRQRLSQPPAFKWLEATGSVRSLLYQGEPYQGRTTDVFAYYATPGTLAGKPDLARSLAAVVLIHGGGDRANREWVKFWAGHGYAAISMDLAGCGPALDGSYDALYKTPRLPRGGPGQDGTRKITDINLPIQDQWPCQAVANVLLAHSLIRNFAEVDPDRTAVSGISWGGYLTAIAAGVDPRFKAAAPFYGCGFLAENSVWKNMGLFDRLTPDERDRWTRLWDPSRYAGFITAPVLAITGARDFAYPLESFAKTYSRVKSDCQYRITPDMGHGAPFMMSTPEVVVFMDHLLKGAPGLVRVDEPRVVTGRVSAAVEAGAGILSAEFHFTAADGPGTNRVWVITPATVEGQTLSAERPPAGARLGYFTVKDRRNTIVSSAVMRFGENE
jgi:cephalosporin-C deacetylase-like acetyl esterase